MFRNEALFISILFAIIVFVSSTEDVLSSTNLDTSAESGKVLSIFNVVRFRNEPCAGSSSRNGTCYTAQECEQRDGTSSGTCAEGYGVCCIFTIGCGMTTNENCTYFESGTTTVSAGACTAKVCRQDSDICFIRLDFNMFTISGPSTSGGVFVAKNGIASPSAGGLQSANGQCLTDSFVATNPGGQNPPTVCGTLTGDHMFVEAANPCNDLTFNFGMDAASGVTRAWTIKASQISCTATNAPPMGCTQYFTATTGTIQSFNFNNGGSRHLANQDQNICIRRTRGMCLLCVSHGAIDTDFMISLAAATATGINNAIKDSCCNHVDTKGSNGYDCLIIPSALKQMGKGNVGASAFCGNKLVTKAGLVGINNTVCTRREPFNIRFVTNEFEAKNEGTGNQGFRLTYFQESC